MMSSIDSAMTKPTFVYVTFSNVPISGDRLTPFAVASFVPLKIANVTTKKWYF